MTSWHFSIFKLFWFQEGIFGNLTVAWKTAFWPKRPEYDVSVKFEQGYPSWIKNFNYGIIMMWQTSDVVMVRTMLVVAVV